MFDNSLNIFDNDYIYYVKILSYEKETQYRYKYQAKIEAIDGKNGEKIELGYRNIEVMLYSNKKTKYSYGDELKCKLELEKPLPNSNTGGFNYKLFLYSNGICGSAYIDEVIECKNNQEGMIYRINEIKYNICEKIDKSFNVETANIIRTMLLNDESTLDVETKNIFYDIGVAHILVPSSTHLMYILMMITYLGQIIGLKFKYKNILTILVIYVYLVVTNFSVSILRIFLMYLVGIVLGFVFKRMDLSNIDKMCIVLLIILMYNPLMIINVGLILSFVSVLGIIILNNKVKYMMINRLKIKDGNKLGKGIVETLSVTFSVQIVITPILMNCFNTIYITALFANVFLVPLSGMLIILSIVFALLYNIPIAVDLLIFVINVVVNMIIGISSFFEILPLSKLLVFPLNFFEVILYYGIIYTIFFSKDKYIYGKNILIRLVECIKRIPKVIRIVIGIILVTIISINVYVNHCTVKIDVIDVGQGDSILIQAYGKNILIDGGGNKNKDFDIGQRTLLPHLLAKRINCLDYVFVSHFDNDHYGGLKAIVENLKIKNIIIGKNQKNTEEFLEFMELVYEKNIPVTNVEEKDIIYLGEKTYFNILYPNNEYVPDSVNNNSIVMKLHYYNFSCLFTGDIEKEVEQYLIDKKIDLSADVLKVAHHGSKTSSIQQFIQNVNPQISVICVGRNNSFGHPSKQTIEHLENINSKIYRTDINGEIKISKYKANTMKIWTMF